MFKCLGLFGLLIACELSFANLLKAYDKQQFITLTHAIDLLKKNLQTHQHQKNLSEKNLASVEKSISDTLEQLESLSLAQKPMIVEIKALNQKINRLAYQLHQQQIGLERLVILHYKTPAIPSFLELIAQNDFDNRLHTLELYRYLIRNYQKIIKEIKNLQAELTSQKQQLTFQLTSYHHLQQQILNRQTHLIQQKIQHSRIIKQLKTNIIYAEENLHQQELNKQRLAKLLPSLTFEKKNPAKYSFKGLSRPLPFPLGAYPTRIKKRKQGLFFYAPESTPIYAVADGKVVFSNWLKGYGLLLIIDHGQGYMTLYAHGQALLKHQGQNIKAHEKIAYCGYSGGLSQSGLYFELRHQGKILQALGWLKYSSMSR